MNSMKLSLAMLLFSAGFFTNCQADDAEGFTSLFGPARYGLPPNEATVTLTKTDDPVRYPAKIETADGPVTLFDPGHPLRWRVS